ncbi:hypothetical protein GOP47_0029412 [Adiantum capillus-veneris]|nr:hypothetical protein GOP47_0029412 [Adiantum capillus-veneris]
MDDAVQQHLLLDNGALQEDGDEYHKKEDLQPIPLAHRTFSGLDIACFWGLLTVALANFLQLLLLICMGHSGTKYGIPFPVLCRSSLGTRGAHIAACLRGVSSCGWFGIDTWIGAQALFVFLDALCNGSLQEWQAIAWIGISLPQLGCFGAFWLFQVGFIWQGMDGIRYLEKYSAPLLFILCVWLLLWACVKAGGLQEMLSASSQFGPGGAKQGQFWSVFSVGLTANFSLYSSMSLSISDITRFARSQKDQVLGHATFPFLMIAFSFVGLAVSSSTAVIFGIVISNPVEILAQIGGITPTIISLLGMTLVIVTTNVANIIAPSNALINLFPESITFRLGALITAVVGVLMQPWRLFANSQTLFYKWLLGLSLITGPLTGIIVVDYYIVRHCVLDIDALYYPNTVPLYWYSKGYNLKAVVAFFVGFLPNVLGFLYSAGVLSHVPFIFRALYEVSWFSSFFLGALSFWVFSVVFKARCNPIKAEFYGGASSK